MPTCGYVCPSCEGRGIDNEGNDCTWCNQENYSTPKNINKEKQNSSQLEKTKGKNINQTGNKTKQE
ncbi:MAG: hypothetical protein EAZ07_04660 [Cytophagales bacterium]|nr:MAG: hypothetical protein EAZ07_04660 [Cytophagales bacterium]